MAHLISASILNADFSNLKKEIDLINVSRTDWFHLDIMDGVFVPNISFGFPIIEQVKKYAQKPLDVHLMIIEPDKYIEQFKAAGADILTVHYEACPHLHRTIQNIKAHGMKAGVSLNPHTPVSVLEDIIQDLDLVLIMTVNPGFGGQKFISNSYNKISRLKKLIIDKKSTAVIEVDGGVDLSNTRMLVDAGVDVLVVGSFIFKSDNPTTTIDALKNA
ncbi:MAG: ribulose-phosphate 3-epimerase [Bacteroidota bacterium]|nr:ribulose-phosphate 3-epimerase [Bacteroidota bacterium]